MRLYEVYGDIECPVCGSSEHNQDNGPYENIPGYAEAVGDSLEDPRLHRMTCLNCHKGFDAGPAELAWTLAPL
jgi:hypothetical protein